ncbi:MAG: sigma-54-dependent Fis family transcriptional regulator [Spartobacteria bacterium]|nr:sigma-54-dependent Fis family transcriptional regulator [Spartobacteria bacterium]
MAEQMTQMHVLVVEDDALLRKNIHDRLKKWGHTVEACEAIAEAKGLLADEAFDLALLDMRLPDGDGLVFLDELRADYPQLDVVMMTAYADVRTAVAALKKGAFDYLPKPFEDAHLEKIVRNAANQVELTQCVATLTKLTSGDQGAVWEFDNMIGTGALGKVFETTRRIAQSADTTVLIQGESGTGKGMLAKAIHRISPRAGKPFVDINCSAIPEQLMESEIFGYEKGAFTDAKNRKPGLMEIANGGTVFLDEIGDMDLNLQGKLLKVLEDKEFRRLGGAQKTKVDIRIVAATNRDLKQRVQDGKFREDLYYRLSVIPIHMPPLREHPDSIKPLADYYLRLFSRQMGRDITGLSPQAENALMTYAWPGNIRELRNVLERGVLLEQGTEVDVDALGISDGAIPHPVPSAAGNMTPMSLIECEKQLIRTVLDSVDGNKNKAAGILEIHRTTLYKKIEEYGL